MICPDPYCSTPALSSAEILSNLSSSEIASYETKVRDWMIYSDPNAIFCRRPLCRGIVTLNPQTGHWKGYTRCKADGCRTKHCVKCGTEPHAFQTCAWAASNRVTNYMAVNRVKICPSCRAPIEKNGGCNHMCK